MSLLLEQVCAQRAVERGALLRLCETVLCDEVAEGDREWVARLTECPRVAGLFVSGALRCINADYKDLEARVRTLIVTLLRKHAELFRDEASSDSDAAAPRRMKRKSVRAPAALPDRPEANLALEPPPAEDEEPLQIALTSKGTRRLCLTHDMSWLADPAYASSLIHTDELFRKEFGSQREEPPDFSGLLDRPRADEDVTMMFEEDDISSMLRDDRSSERVGFCTQQSDLARQILNQLDENTDYERLKANMPTCTPVRPPELTPLPPKSTIVRMHERSAIFVREEERADDAVPADGCTMPQDGGVMPKARRKSEARKKGNPSLLQYGRVLEGDKVLNVEPASFTAPGKRVWKACRSLGLNPDWWTSQVVSTARSDGLFQLPPTDLLEMFLHRELTASSLLARDDPHLREEEPTEPPESVARSVIRQHERPTPIAQATPAHLLVMPPCDPPESVTYSSRRRTPTFTELPLVPVGGALTAKAAFLNSVLQRMFDKRGGEALEWVKLLPADARRWQAAVCFANLLQLVAQGYIHVIQPTPFAPITLAPPFRKRCVDQQNMPPDNSKRLRTT